MRAPMGRCLRAFCLAFFIFFLRAAAAAASVEEGAGLPEPGWLN